MLQRIGADAVGMSTVPEVIAARARGVRCLGFSSITNVAAGLTTNKLSHLEVLEAGERGARPPARPPAGVGASLTRRRRSSLSPPSGWCRQSSRYPGPPPA